MSKTFIQGYDNKKVIENMKVRQNINLEWVAFFFVKLYKLIQYQKINSNNILNANKLVKKNIVFNDIQHQYTTPTKPYINTKKELINLFSNKKKV